MSSQVINEIKGDPNFKVSQGPEPAPAPETPAIDYSPMKDDSERKHFDEISNNGELLFESLIEEIVKPIADIQFFNIFKIKDVSPIRINSHTIKTVIKKITINLESEDYKDIVPHIYKFVLIMPPRYLVKLDLGGASGAGSGIQSIMSTKLISSTGSMKQSTSKPSDSKALEGLKAVYPICEEIPKSFFDKKIKEFEKFTHEKMKKIPVGNLLRRIDDALSSMKADECGEDFILSSQSSEADIENIVLKQIVDPVLLILDLILRYPEETAPNIEAKPQKNVKKISNDDHELPKYENFRPDLTIGSYDALSLIIQVDHVIEFKKPNLFLDAQGYVKDIQGNKKFGEIFRQPLYYCAKLQLDHSTLSDGFGFLFFIFDNDDEPSTTHQYGCNSASINAGQAQLENDSGSAPQKLLTCLTFNGLNSKNYLPLFSKNCVPTKMLIALIAYMTRISKGLLKEGEAKEKMRSILDRAKEANEDQKGHHTDQKDGGDTNENQNYKNESTKNHEYKDGDLSPLSSDILSLNHSADSSDPSSASSNNSFVATLPKDFKDYEVIQGEEHSITQVIKITKRSFQRYFMPVSNSSSLGGSMKQLDSDIILKIYSYNNLENYYINYAEGRDQFINKEQFVNFILKEKFKNEVEINLIVEKFNNTVDESEAVNSPRMLAFGAMKSNEYITPFRGFFIAFEEIKTGGNEFSEKHLNGLITEVEKIHSLGIAHCDIAIRNVLIDQNDSVSVIDFNNAVDVSNASQSEINHLFELDKNNIAKIKAKIESDKC